MAGGTDGGELCSLPLAAPRKEKGGTGRDRKLQGVREDKSADAEVGRDCRRVERRRRAQSPVWPASVIVPSRRCTVSSFK